MRVVHHEVVNMYTYMYMMMMMMMMGVNNVHKTHK